MQLIRGVGLDEILKEIRRVFVTGLNDDQGSPSEDRMNAIEGGAAALALGCDGINMGTRFLVTQEAPIHEGIKQKVVEMDENQTRLIFRSYKNTARVYRNTVADEVAAFEATGADFGQVHHLVSGANQEKAWSTGDIDAGMVTVGMSGGLINDIPTCEELVRNIVSEAEQIIAERLASIAAA